MANSDEDWKAEETNKTDKSFKDARASYSKPFDEEGLTEDDKLFGVDPYYLEESEKKVEGSVKAADLWDSIQSVVKKFKNLIKRKDWKALPQPNFSCRELTFMFIQRKSE